MAAKKTVNGSVVRAFLVERDGESNVKDRARFKKVDIEAFHKANPRLRYVPGTPAGQREYVGPRGAKVTATPAALRAKAAEMGLSTGKKGRLSAEVTTQVVAAMVEDRKAARASAKAAKSK